MKLIHLVIAVVMVCLVDLSAGDMVDTDEACGKVGTYYRQGCTGLVAELLGRRFKVSGNYRRGSFVGSNGRYSALPGEIVGFPGHVAVYVGKTSCNCNFVDVPGPGGRGRCINSYGSQNVYRYYY